MHVDNDADTSATPPTAKQRPKPVPLKSFSSMALTPQPIIMIIAELLIPLPYCIMQHFIHLINSLIDVTPSV